MKKFKNFLSIIIIILLMITVVGCSQNEPISNPEGQNAEEQSTNTEKESTESDSLIGGEMILATTTSTENSGLLDYILPDFTEKTGVDVKVVAVGTGNALQMGRDGEADVLLVHAKASEEEFVEEGHGRARYDVMYNDFVIIGPESDPAALKENTPNDAIAALTILNDTNTSFISRGDNSGTNKKEISLWKEANITPEGDWYISAGKGMGDTITMANEMLAYTISDRATYLSMKENIDLVVLVEGDGKLFNQYGVIPVDPNKNDKINEEAANAFVEWLLSQETQELINSYEKFGEVLFTPNAK